MYISQRFNLFQSVWQERQVLRVSRIDRIQPLLYQLLLSCICIKSEGIGLSDRHSLTRQVIRLSGMAAIVALATGRPALADDRPFITLYTTDLLPAHEAELEQTFRWASGHAHESFNEFISNSEFEYGITDNLQGELYLNYEWSRTRPHDPLSPAENENLTGVSGELIWRVMSPYSDPFGLAFYVEPSVFNGQHGLEFKIIGQKNFLDDALRTVVNVNFENTCTKDAGRWSKESALEFDFGVAYNVTPHWAIGAEFDNERGFDGLILGGPATESADAYFLGPTVQYADEGYRIVFGAQVQLPIATNPGGTPGPVVDGFTADAEHFRMGVRIAKEL